MMKYNDEICEFWEIVDKKEDCDYMYGGCDFVLTDADIAALKAGKIINFSVNCEYGCTLSLEVNHDEN